MNEKQIISNLPRSIGDLGISGLSLIQMDSTSRPITIDLAFGDNNMKFICEVKSDARWVTIEKAISQLERWRHTITGREHVKACIVVPFLSEQMRKKLKDRDISFIDLSGNVFINDPGLMHIEREGKPNKFTDSQVSRNIFADKRSLVLRYLFLHPKRFIGVREIAAACGINPGGVSVALGLLEEAGYVARDDRGHGKLVRWKELLEDWASYYKQKKQRELAFYWNMPSLEKMLHSLAAFSDQLNGRLALTGHAGAHLIAPFVNYQGLHAYITGAEAVNDIAKTLKLRKTERGANVFLLEPYYKESVLYGVRKIDGIDVVSDVQLYLDLKNFPVRGIEQAENLLQKIIEPSMEEHG